MQRLGYNATQTNALVIAGQLGLYGTAFFWGNLCDKKGPRFVSFCSGLLFGIGYVLMGLTYGGYLPNVSFLLTAAYYSLAGMGTCASYMSGVTTNARNFPNHIGKAMGITLAAFGISGFVLGQLSRLFHDGEGRLRVEAFFYFLAILLFIVGTIGSLALIQLPPEEDDHDDDSSGEDSPLLPRSTIPKDGVPFFRDHSTYIFAAVLLLLTGVGEMVINSFGSMLYALSSKPPADLQGYHVSLISLANFFARLLSGLLSDTLSRYMSHPRLALLLVSAILLTMSQAWVWLYLQPGQDGISHFWILSVGSGIGYGAIFSLAPSIVGKVWGVEQFGRNWGLLSLSPALGSCLLNLLYSLVYDAHRREQEIGQAGKLPSDALCHGVECFRTTFGITTFVSAAGCIGVVILWQVWNRRGRRV